MIGKIQDVVAASVAISAPSVAEKTSAEGEQIKSTGSLAPAATYDSAQAATDASALEKTENQQPQDEGTGKAVKQQMDEESVSRMTEELNELMSKINCSIEFSYHKEVDMLSVKMTDSQTGEVIKEYPPEELIQGMITAREWIGAFIDRNA